MTTVLYPQTVKKGDTVGVFAPAGNLVEKERFMRGVSILEDMGFAVKFPRELWPGTGYFADTDSNRALEFNRLFRDPDVKALLALRGGYGCLRMLDKIDLAQVAATPKLLVGFSDLTVLQNFLYDRTGLMSLHGPVVTSLGDATSDSLQRYFHSLTGKWSSVISDRRIEVLREGVSHPSPLIGGNLTSLVTLIGTEYDFSWENKIVLLEDINEPVFRIDRMLTQLKLAGKFEGVSGLILGDFSFAAKVDAIEKLRYQEAIWTRVLELLDEISVPIWGAFPSGHCPHNLTLPLGATTEMNREKMQLIFY